MGTDIHGVWQKLDGAWGAEIPSAYGGVWQKKEAKWIDIPSNYEQDRHYQLFAVLAGVRNGVGFAGCKMGEPVKPIALPRGLPEDFEMDDELHHVVASPALIDPRRREWMVKYNDSAEDACKVWMGDHSQSWLFGEELLSWYANAPVVVKTGIMDRKDYETWDHNSPPENYCGGISGRDIIVVNDNAAERHLHPNWTHIQVEWDQALHEELAYFFDEVRRLVAEHGTIRFVFGFDS